MECQLPLAVCYLCTGSILKRKGQLADAEAAFHAESRIMAELAERRRDKPEYRLLLVYGRIQHAEVLMQMERIEEAQQELDETINLIHVAMADSPKVPRYRTLLVSASELLARLRQQCQEGQLNYSGEKQR